VAKFNEYSARVHWDDKARKARFWDGLKSRIKIVIAVVSYPKNFQDIMALAVHLNDNFNRLNDSKKVNLIKYPNKKKERDPDVIN
jgi:hypothetical protein